MSMLLLTFGGRGDGKLSQGLSWGSDEEFYYLTGLLPVS